METYHPPKEVEEKDNNSDLPEKEVISEKWLLEKIDSLIPLIKEKWPNIAQQTLEATKGSIDDLVEVIASHSGTSACLLYTSPSPRDPSISRMPSSA